MEKLDDLYFDREKKYVVNDLQSRQNYYERWTIGCVSVSTVALAALTATIDSKSPKMHKFGPLLLGTVLAFGAGGFIECYKRNDIMQLKFDAKQCQDWASLSSIVYARDGIIHRRFF